MEQLICPAQPWSIETGVFSTQVERMAHVHVLTISDRCAAGAAVDTSGPYIAERIEAWRPGSQISHLCVPDEIGKIQEVFQNTVQAANSVSKTFITSL